MKRHITLLAATAAMLALGTAAFATTFNPNNELDNWCFIYGPQGWEVAGNVAFNGNGTIEGGAPVHGRGHIAYVPQSPSPGLLEFPIPGSSGSLRQVVDDSQYPGWNPDLTRKIGYLSFDLYTPGFGTTSTSRGRQAERPPTTR